MMVALTDAERVALIMSFGVILAAAVPGVGWMLKRVIEHTTAHAAQQVITRNSAEHVVNKQVLDRIERKVDWQSAKLDEQGEKIDSQGQMMSDHLAWHLNRPKPKKEAAA